MVNKATKQKTKFKGVYYRQHPTRRNGVRYDRYFIIRYSINGKQRDEGYGWESEGYTETKAAAEVETIRNNIKNKTGYFSLKEKAEIAEAEKKATAATLIVQERENITYRQFYENIYKPSYIDENKPKEGKVGAHINHILPVIGNMRLIDIKPIHLETIKANMTAAGRAPASVNKVLVYISHVFNMAKNNDYFTGDNPVSKVKKIKIDNRRIRFLSKEEAAKLFERLSKMEKPTVFDMSLLALCCGLRAGEIFKLQAVDINFSIRRLYVRDPKGVVNRALPLPQIVFDMLRRRCAGLKPDDYLFMKTDGSKHINSISDQYQRIADSLFNQNITDSRNKVVFHTLRHTFASWLAMDGVDINTISELMGHATLEMTKRYMHLAPNKFDSAVTCLENPLSMENISGTLTHSATQAQSQSKEV